MEYELTIPSWMAGHNLHLSTVRVQRVGGPTPADVRFREWLYGRIGAITVASGQIEASMKRLLLAERRETDFTSVDLSWADLDKKLRAAVAGGPHEQGVLAVLDWGVENRIKEARDNAVHAAWWEFAPDDGYLHASRFPRRDSPTTIISTPADIDEMVGRLREYARRLDELVGHRWSSARLPESVRLVARPPNGQVRQQRAQPRRRKRRRR